MKINVTLPDGSVRSYDPGATAMDEQYRRFRHFVELFEAILAYHTANERKQS